MAKVRLSKVSSSGWTENGLTIEALDLEIPDGQFVVLAGSPGSGTSGIVRMIAGLDNISAGEITIGEERVEALAPKERDGALVFANDSLHPNMTARENIAFGLKRRRFGHAEIRKRIEEAANILLIGDLLEQKPNRLSLIQKQRVAIARAVVRQPKVLLFDHALAYLDANDRAELAQVVVRLHERMQTTMIFATANSSEAMSVAETIAVFDKGMLRAFDKPRVLYEQPDDMFVAKFLGDPPMNFIRGELKLDRGLLLFREAESGTIELDLSKHERFGDPASLNGRTVFLGIRPENVELLNPVDSRGQKPKSSFRAIAEVVLPLGSGTDIHFNTGAHLGIARSARLLDRRETGHRMEFIVNLEKICLFEPDLGKRMGAS